MGARAKARFACLAEPAFILGLLAFARATGSLSVTVFPGPAVGHLWSVAAASVVLVAAGLLVGAARRDQAGFRSTIRRPISSSR